MKKRTKRRQNNSVKTLKKRVYKNIVTPSNARRYNNGTLVKTLDKLVKLRYIKPKTSKSVPTGTRPKLYSNLNTKIPDNCPKRIKTAQKSRRKAFFKSKARGNTSARPEHMRKHQRTC